jgi:large subunit ribosomal protein L21
LSRHTFEPIGGVLTTYAIIQTGGKQYRVEQGDTIRVETLPNNDGDNVELEQVLMVSKNGDINLGDPTLPKAKVTAQVVGHGRHKKIRVFKYKAKTRYRKMQGHRQGYTELKVTGISV